MSSSEVEVEGVVLSLVHSSQTGTVALQLDDGRIRKLLWGRSTTLGDPDPPPGADTE